MSEPERDFSITITIERHFIILVIFAVFLLFPVTILTFSAASCSGDGGGQRLTGAGTGIFSFREINGGAGYSVSAGAAAEADTAIVVAIPAYYRPNAESDYLPVMGIDMDAFNGRGSIVKVTIPATVTTIGSGAFYGCSSLTSISLPATVTDIGDYAFSNCTSLPGITIPAGVMAVGEYAFGAWTAVQTINVQGKADRQAALSAGWNNGWDIDCEAVVKYGK